MAGEPVPLATLQAATLKAAASKQAVAPVQSTQQGAVAQDLAIMADQAKGYAAGAAAGNVEAEKQRGAASSRMAEERAQADAARSRDAQQAGLEMQQFAVEQQRRSQSNAIALKEAAAEQKRSAATAKDEGDPAEDARRDSLVGDVYAHANAHISEGPRTAFGSVIKVSRSYEEAMAYFDKKQREPDPANRFEGVKRSTIERYVKAFYRATEGQNPNLPKAGSSGPKPQPKPDGKVRSTSSGGSWGEPSKPNPVLARIGDYLGIWKK